MAKAKWLEESSNSQLLAIIRKSFEEEASQAAINKAEKAAIELEERTPEGDPTIPEVLEALQENIDALAKAYEQEVEALVEEDEEPEDEVELPDEVEELPEDEEELPEYEEMTLKDLRAEARARKVAVPAKAKKDDLIAALEAADEEDLEADVEEEIEADEEEIEIEEEFETGYDEMTLKALKAEARTRGIRVTNKMKKEDLIEILQDDDEE